MAFNWWRECVLCRADRTVWIVCDGREVLGPLGKRIHVPRGLHWLASSGRRWLPEPMPVCWWSTLCRPARLKRQVSVGSRCRPPSSSLERPVQRFFFYVLGLSTKAKGNLLFKGNLKGKKEKYCCSSSRLHLIVKIRLYPKHEHILIFIEDLTTIT